MPRWPMRLPRHADLFDEMLKQLGIEQADVFGVSWGGALAQEFALRYPSGVRRLIFAANATPWCGGTARTSCTAPFAVPNCTSCRASWLLALT
ncbi:alpha/beta hydrolase [Pseudomonas sp. WJP1]|uniref:alpha/beta fold hydrolase n=1 Tax=Pseudomonas sp. WJP1 TaxID=2986947 RepID=UPI00234AEB6B|nr:alpha/beta hydrolase [Pseudomonas sp. WJP1]WCM49424.1 alpha/beta hydrolase [Pseudomonas sp. WJP1]